MTPVRAALAAFLAAVMLLAGVMIVARAAGRDAADLFEVLLAGPGPGLSCFLAALGALVLGGLGVIAAFLAFIAQEEPDDGPFRRRGFPKSAPIVLIALALGLAWFALQCASAPAPDAPVAVAMEPEAPPVEELEIALAGGDPAPPPVIAAAADFSWSYQNPLIRRGAGLWAAGETPFTDNDEARRLLCGKAWIAVSGSASEEGPADRNAIRSRLRALAAAEAARRAVKSLPDCVAGPLLAVDLGQHEAGASSGGGEATAYQRQLLVITRARNGDEVVDEAAARAELSAFLADPANRAALLAGRRFPAEPVILTP
jgi:hypothetical protein